jgi:RNA polymerase sigma-70 factor (ECF subfamily)
MELVRAALAGTPASLAALDRAIEAAVAPLLRRMVGQADVPEVLQQLRIRLLVGSGRPGLLDYQGEGALATWLRVVASRIAIDHLRARGRDRVLCVSSPEPLLGQAASAESQLGHAEQRAQLSLALRQALTTLPVRDQTLLKLHHLQGLTVDDLAPSYQVHRATVARWLGDARGRLRQALTAELVAAGVEVGEIEAVISLELSQLEAGLSQS